VSYACYYHGYEGGQDNLVFSDYCAELPFECALYNSHTAQLISETSQLDLNGRGIYQQPYKFGPGRYKITPFSGHPLAFFNQGKESLFTISGGGLFLQDSVDTPAFIHGNGPGSGAKYYNDEITINVSGDFGTISYACYFHGYEGGQNNVVYDTICFGASGPEPGVYESGAAPDPDFSQYTYQDCYIKFNAQTSQYTISDINGTAIFDPDNPDQTTPILFAWAPGIPFPAYYISPTTEQFMWRALGIYATSQGDYKITKLYGYGYPSNYFGLTDVYGNIQYSDSQTFPPIPWVVDWNGVTAFPFTAQRAPGNNYTNPDINNTFNIIGLHQGLATSIYKIKQPNIGTFPSNPTYYYVVDSNGTVVQDQSAQDVVIEWDSETDTFPTTKYSVNESYGPGYVVSAYFETNNEGNFRLSPLPGNGLYNLIDLEGNPVPNPGDNNESNVQIAWDKTGTFPFKKRASNYSVVLYNIVGIVTSVAATDYYAIQRVENNLPVTNSYTIVDYDETPLEFNSTPVTTTILPTKVFPYTQAFNTDDPFTLYKVLSKYIIVKSPYKIKDTTTDGVYKLVDLEGTVIKDPGTNETTDITVSWDGVKPFPFNTLSDSNYEAFIYRVIGRYVGQEDVTASATGPITTSNDTEYIPSTSYNLASVSSQTTFIGVTGPTGSYTGPTYIEVTAPTGASGPAITNNINGKVTSIFGGINKIGVETTMNDWTILFTQT
jgi:hypothetical protein